MSSDSKLPPYTENPAFKAGSAPSDQITANRIAGNVQTCSIKDLQLDYLKIVRQSATSYYICLSVDPTPIYRIECISDSTKIGDIQIFPASNTALPAVAAARLSRNPKRSEPVAMICTSEPHLPDARWQPFTRGPMLSINEDYHSSIPIIAVPGTAPTSHQFAWRTNLCDPFFELWWDGPLPLVSSRGFIKDDRDSRYVFTRVARRTAETGENLIEIRRGGGLEFELSVVLQIFVILQHQNKQLI